MMIKKRYVLFNSTPILKDLEGRYTCDPFWAKDLRLHLDYIENLVLCCPVIETNQQSDLDALKKMVSYNFGDLTDITDDGFEVVPLKYSFGFVGVFKHLISNFFRVKNALSKGCVAHSDGAGWPFPISFYLLLLKPFMQFNWLMLVESTFWMVKEGDKFNFRKQFTHYAHKLLLPLCLKYADMRVLTNAFYKDLFNVDEQALLVSEYSCLDSEHMISEEAIALRTSNNRSKSLRLILAARLMEEKGIGVLLKAIELLREQGVEAQIDIMGSGLLEQTCKDFAKLPAGSVHFSFIEPVPYGPTFFDYIAQYDVLLLANLTNEQPRIILDAYGQALSVIASDTPGIKTICKHLHNSLLYKTGDAVALAEAITYATTHRDEMSSMALSGFEFAKTKTHQNMHEVRAKFLAEQLN